MGVNDIITTGAEPLFFLDYFATGKLDTEKAARIIKGIVKGCKEAGCALVGGETAEMPDFYKPEEYDLAGFTVGIVEKEGIVDGSTIKPGDKVIGLASSGFHSNGYTLARKVIFEKLGLRVNSKIKGLKRSLGEELLTPTRIYVKPILSLLKRFRLKGIAHITGGGFVENIPRILPKGCKAVIKKGSWPVPFIFKFLQEAGNIPEMEMFRTFNCGIGMVVVVSREDEPGVLNRLKDLKERAYIIGEVVKRRGGENSIEIMG
jgi:phosphoribosylformylglycinamidine cyclo-ligase